MIDPAHSRRSAAAREFTEAFEGDKWSKDIPFIRFPRGYEVKVIPTFGGALVRFLVKKKDSDKKISVYLDCYEMLGLWSKPHWEIYPDRDGNNTRYAMEDVDALLGGIALALEDL